MRVLGFIFAIIVALYLETVTADVPQVIRFGDTVEDYIIFAPNMEPFTEQFSLCSWVKKSRTGFRPNWFSYATISRSWEINLSDDGHSRLFSAHSLNKMGQLGITPGTWYHYCMCWSLSSNMADVYHNGMKVGSMKTRTGRRLRTGGSLVLGQLQFSYRTVSGHPFGGELFKLDIFSKKFSAEEVSAMYQAGLCSQIEKSHGNFRQLTWESITQQSRRGNVELINLDSADTGMSCPEQSPQHDVDTNIGVEVANTACEQQLSQVQSDLEAINTELESLRQTRSESQTTQAELELAESEKNRLQAELDEAKTDLEATQTDLDSTQTQLEAAQSELEMIKNQLKVAQTEHEDTKSDLGQKLNQIQSELTEAQNQLMASQSEQAATKAELATARAELSAAQTDLEATKSELEAAQSQAQATRADLGQGLSQTQTELEITLAELEDTQTDLEETQTKLEEIQAELERTQTQLEDSQANFEKSQTELEKSQTEQMKTQRQLEESQTQLEMSQTQFAESQTELERIQTRLRETTTQLEETQTQLALSTRTSTSNVPLILKFGKSLQDYIIFRPNMGPFTEQFSICSWVKKLRPDGFPFWLSYATSGDIEIKLNDNGYSGLLGDRFFNNIGELGINPGSWYHYCMVWSLSSGIADIFYDGTKAGFITTPSEGVLGTGGALVLGQYQRGLGIIDNRRGIRYSFGGEISKLNIFSKKLSAEEVRNMYQAGICSDVEKIHGENRKVTWESIILQTRRGNVQLLDLADPCSSAQSASGDN